MPDPATQRIQALVAGLVNYERTRPNAIRWTLAGMTALLARPGAQLPGGVLVQVGGSKGKGTVAAMLEGLGESSGLATGTYLSPHVETVLERIRLHGRQIGLAALERVLEPVLAFVRESGLATTFFEVMTAAAVQAFAEHRVAMGILEVGLGGRLDATTAVPVQGSILTNVELEHTALLGDTVEEIAAEKAFVARPGCPLVTAVQAGALRVVRDHARRVGAELVVLGEDCGVEGLRAVGSGFAGTLRDLGGEALPFELPDATRVEVDALALALVLLRRLFPGREFPTLPVSRPRWPGRFEVVTLADGRTLVLDGAHTERSLAALAEELARRFPGQRVALLFASAIDKRWQGGLSRLLPLADRVVTTRLADTSCVEPDEIVTWCRSQGTRAAVAADAREGLAELARWPGLGVVTGSFYLVGAVREVVRTSARS